MNTQEIFEHLEKNLLNESNGDHKGVTAPGEELEEDFFGEDDCVGVDIVAQTKDFTNTTVASTLLHKVRDRLNQLCEIYVESIQFPLSCLVKPLITYEIKGNLLSMLIKVDRECFEPGYIEKIEKELSDYRFNDYAIYESGYEISINTEEDRRMAEYILTFNALPLTHRTFWNELCILQFEGFKIFDIPIDNNWFEEYKEKWQSESENQATLRRRKIDWLELEGVIEDY